MTEKETREFMRKYRVTIIASLAAVCLLLSTQAFGASDEVETKGMIIARTGETLIVNGPNGKVTVVLTGDTETKDNTGLFGLDEEHMSSTVLIPGLKVKVEGVSDGQGRVSAKEITVDGDDLETAEMIQSGLHPTAEQVAANLQAIEANRKNVATNQENISANRQNISGNQQNISANREQIDKNIKDIEEHTNRFTALADYEVKAAATVNFDVASTKISAQDQEELSKLAQTATGLTGYIIEVTGYADSTGSAATNTKLSENRAKAVVIYLMQKGNVPVRHIVAPGAMGEYGPVSSNETKAGRAGNRRVEVKVLVNKGITGI
jgi:outer membrane protein OmpA-like peptidoglycan-associated protein